MVVNCQVSIVGIIQVRESLDSLHHLRFSDSLKSKDEYFTLSMKLPDSFTYT